VDHAFKRAERGDALIYVPTIVLAECVYPVEKGRISLRYYELFSRLGSRELRGNPFDAGDRGGGPLASP